MSQVLNVECAIAGGGPAGLMLGYLLARAGVRVVVLEKHADFLRDFRGDTVHPSTLEVMSELGLIDRFLALQHQKVNRLTMQFGRQRFIPADFSKLPVRCPYIAMMPQWDLLNFLAEEGERYSGFELLKSAEANDLIIEKEVVRGLRATTLRGNIDVRASLVVGADGRSSKLRAASGLEVIDIGAPMDALWFRLSRRPTDTDETQGRFDPGRVFVMLNRGDYWQCAFVIPKGSLDHLKDQGLQHFKDMLGELLPFEAGRAEDIGSWDDVKLLAVKVDRLKKWWREGLLFIGDAAHAMSPVGGVGINLAIQDAVAAANILSAPLREGTLSNDHLQRVEARRTFPTMMTQRLQVGVQNGLIASALSGQNSATVAPPLLVRLLNRVPYLRRFPARLVGLGIRPEHVSEAIREAKG